MIELRLLGALVVRDLEGRDLGVLVSQPKRLALLAYLAVADGFHRRDRLVAVFWPELDAEHARTALRKGIHALRGVLGESAVPGHGVEEIGLAATHVRSDVAEFELALDEARLADAMALYRGDLLDGFFISDAPEFERWLERERVRLRGRAAAAAWALAQEREDSGDPLTALQTARRAMELSPADEAAVRRLIAMLDRLGDRTGALHAYESFARELADEFAAQPSAETQSLIEAVRSRAARISGSALRVDTAPPPRRGMSKVLIAALVLLLVAGAWTANWLRIGRALPVTTSSRAAYAAYADGLNAYDAGSYAEAQRAFDKALELDSTFALAAYYAAMTALLRSDDSYGEHLERAMRFADRASERERLLIRATAADQLGDANALALAESLATRHPEERAGQDLVGRALISDGDFLGAIPHLERAASAGGEQSGDGEACRSCDALGWISYAYAMADSMDASVRVSREWVRRSPGSPAAWHQLSLALEIAFRLDEALGANRTTMGLRSTEVADRLFPAVVAMRAGRFALADAAFAPLLRDTAASVRDEARWFQIISLRSQGRFREALTEARRHRHGAVHDWESAQFAAPEAQVLLEVGRSRASAALFDSIAATAPEPGSSARAARNRAWYLTHAATALAAAGDTARLTVLADSIEAAGHASNYGRDRLLHHYVRGLLFVARGRNDAAAESFQHANFSLTGGFSGNNLEWSRALLALGRPAEAIPLLQGSLHGPPDAPNLYTTVTDLHEMLARAFDLAGQADSAAAHYRWVVEAWRLADAPFAARRGAAATRLAALETSLSQSRR